jgi:hypothetical protein
MFGVKQRAQGGLNVVHDGEERRIQVTEQRGRERMEDAGMNKTRPGTEEEAMWRNEFLKSH